jgi:hypothetical protein
MSASFLITYLDPVNGETRSVRGKQAYPGSIGPEGLDLSLNSEWITGTWCSETYLSNYSPGRNDVEVLAVEPVKISGTRDIWVLANPTDHVLSFVLHLTKRDANGLFLSEQDADGCPSSGGGWYVVVGELIWLPPGSSVVLHNDLSSDETAQGITQELSVTTLAECSNSDFFARYDPDVVLVPIDDAGESGESSQTFIIENRGSRNAVAGVLYLSVFAADGTPLYGAEVGGLSIGGVPPGERVKSPLDLPDTNEYLGLGPVRFEYLWVGMSE